MTAPLSPVDDAREFVEGLIPGASAASGLMDGVVAVRRWISDRHNWVRVVWFISGLTMVYIGAAWLAKPVVTGALKSPPAKIVTGVAGAGAKGVKKVIA